MGVIKSVAVGVSVVLISRVLIQKFAPNLIETLPILAAETESESYEI